MCVILKNLNNINFILLIRYISDNRLIISNIIILNKKSYLKKFFFYNNLDRNITIIVNDIKYNNNKLNLY